MTARIAQKGKDSSYLGTLVHKAATDQHVGQNILQEKLSIVVYY